MTPLTSDDYVLFLTANGWRVCVDTGLGCVGVGLTRSQASGIDGVPYCDHVFEGRTLRDALAAAWAFAQAQQE